MSSSSSNTGKLEYRILFVKYFMNNFSEEFCYVTVIGGVLLVGRNGSDVVVVGRKKSSLDVCF